MSGLPPMAACAAAGRVSTSRPPGAASATPRRPDTRPRQRRATKRCWLAPGDELAGTSEYDAPGDGALWSEAGGDGGGHGGGGDDEDRAPEQIASQGRGLQAHLEEQLAGARCTPKDRALVRLLIGEVEEDGYIRSSIEEIAAALPPEAGIDPDEWMTALRLLQSFEPTGVGARDLAECLRLQLPQLVDDDTGPEVVELARRLIDDHLGLLGAREFSKLRKFLRCDEEMLRQVQRLIQRLDPRPGRRFGVDDAAYVIPDIVVRRTRQGWRVTLNPDVVPKLRVNDLYARILRSHRGVRGNRDGGRWSARWPGDVAVPRIGSDAPSVGATHRMVKIHRIRCHPSCRKPGGWSRMSNSASRRSSGYRRKLSIDRRPIFSHGAVAMRPLVLREVAQAVGLHESTVSRVTTAEIHAHPVRDGRTQVFLW